MVIAIDLIERGKVWVGSVHAFIGCCRVAVLTSVCQVPDRSPQLHKLGLLVCMHAPQPLNIGLDVVSMVGLVVRLLDYGLASTASLAAGVLL